MMRFLLLSLCVITSSACVSESVPEPALEAQLWRQQGCFAHILSPWQHVEAAALQGVAHSTAGNQSSLPGATVFVRAVGSQAVLRTTTDSSGHFAIPSLLPGDYELSVCADGHNPWRGVVALRSESPSSTLDLTLTLGM